ncbi:MAG: UbiD family decarboxylase [Chloroflexi bacterium]|nr:UbiD family decarboxylase [Chloroflexota bacterium]
MYKDLREYIADVRQRDHVKVIEGADWDLELGLITEATLKKADPPLLIFDRIKGYAAGYRVLTNLLNTPKRTAMTLGLPVELRGLEMVKRWREKVQREFRPAPPVEVAAAPVKEHVHTGADIDLWELPVPKWHGLDGGRYIGTGDMVIQKHPETGWVNLGTYRVQVINKNTVSLHITGGHHGVEISRAYWDRGLPCPVAIVCGQEPLIWTMACSALPRGVGEYDYAGWLTGSPVEVVKGAAVDLPLPAHAEIVIEGEFLPPDVETAMEGPFGEWWGYYGGKASPHPVIRVKAICHRKDPILLGCPPMLPIDNDYVRYIVNSAELWNDLDKHYPGIKGVWLCPEARGAPMCIVSVQQQFPGHARHVATALASSQVLHRWVIVVDDDIDPSNTAEVLWALGTRCEPKTSIDIMEGFWSLASNPRLPPEKRANRNSFDSSRALVYACKPYSWLKDFPPSVKSSPEALRQTAEKWAKELA